MLKNKMPVAQLTNFDYKNLRVRSTYSDFWPPLSISFTYFLYKQHGLPRFLETPCYMDVIIARALSVLLFLLRGLNGSIVNTI